MKYITNKFFIIISIVSLMCSSFVFPSFLPHRAATASDKSFIVAIIDRTPVLVRIENGGTYLSFDGLTFEGGAIRVGNSLIFDMYASSDNGYTANLEFLYSPNNIFSPFIYEKYKLENGAYKPDKNLMYKYYEILKLKQEYRETQDKYKVSSTQMINWKDIFPEAYFLWNNENAYSAYNLTSENNRNPDANGPIKSTSNVVPVGYISNVQEVYRCNSDSYTKTRSTSLNRYIFPIRIYPMATPVDSSRTAGFIMYTRADIFRDTVPYLLSQDCKSTFKGIYPKTNGVIEKIDLTYYRSKYVDGQTYDKYRIHLVDNTDFIESFNPSTKDGGTVITPLISMLAAFIAPAAPEIASGIGILASISGVIETYISHPNVSISKENNILHIKASGSLFHPLEAPIPLIDPENDFKDHWRDISYPIPGYNPNTKTFTKHVPFTPFYISFADDNPENLEEKSVLNISGTIWLSILVSYEKPRTDRKHIHDYFTFKFPVYISLRYRLVR